MATVKSSCGLVGTSRIDIFREIGVDAVSNQIKQEVFDQIADEQYAQFVAFCQKCEEEREKIDSVSCALEDAELKFHIKYK